MTHLMPAGEAIEIWGNENAPEGFMWRGAPHHIQLVCNRWRVHTRWWEAGETLWREYWKVTTDRGILCQLYHDLLAGGWFLCRLYD